MGEKHKAWRKSNYTFRLNSISWNFSIHKWKVDLIREDKPNLAIELLKGHLNN